MTTVSYPQPARADTPDGGQLDRLIAIVAGHCPEMTGGCDTAAYRHDFACALLYCCYAQRRDRPDTNFSLGFWLDQARDWALRHFRQDWRLSISPFVAGCIASRVSYAVLLVEESSGTRRDFVGLGLVRDGDRAPVALWRDTLACGTVEPPADLKDAVAYPHSKLLRTVSLSPTPGWR
jgi:hypothetical protein